MNRWRRLLACAEVEGDASLRLFGAALSFYAYLTWAHWFDQAQLCAAAPAAGNYLPAWPFEHLAPTLVLGKGATRLYMQLLGLSSLALLLAFGQARSLLWPMLGLGFQLVNKTFFYLHDLTEVANFHHVHLSLGFYFLLSANKRFWCRWGLAMVYWMAALVKLTPSWWQGDYFNSVPGHLPLLASSPGWVTFWCRALIVLEIVGPLLWFSRRAAWRRGSAAALLVFHLYSGVIVGFWYTSLMLPLLVAALGRFDEPLQSGYRWRPRDLPLWGFSLLLALGAACPFWIPGDVRVTAEGRYTGLFMFDANRRVTADLQVWKEGRHTRFRLEYDWPRRAVLDIPVRIRDGNGDPVREPVVDDGVVVFNPALFRRASSRMCGDPYMYYFWARQLEQRYHPERIALHLEHQLDGRPEPTVLLDIADFGALNPVYSPWWHNPWVLP